MVPPDTFRIRDVDLSVEIKYNRNTHDMTPTAAKAMVETAEATYLAPVRTIMRYSLAAVGGLLAFFIVLAVLVHAIGLSEKLAIVIVLAAGAAVAAPLGIVLKKMAEKVGAPQPPP